MYATIYSVNASDLYWKGGLYMEVDDDLKNPCWCGGGFNFLASFWYHVGATQYISLFMHTYEFNMDDPYGQCLLWPTAAYVGVHPKRRCKSSEWQISLCEKPR